MVLLPVFALTMVAVWAFVRYQKQLWNTCCLPVCPMNFFSYLPSLPFSHILSSLANTWFKMTGYHPKPCCSNLPRLQILVGEEKFYLKKNWGEGGESLAKNEWEVTYFTRTANKNSAITQRGKVWIFCHHESYLFLSWCALKTSCTAWKEEMIVSKWFSLERVCGFESVSTYLVSLLGTTLHFCSPSNSEAEIEDHLSQGSIDLREIWTIFWISAKKITQGCGLIRLTVPFFKLISFLLDSVPCDWKTEALAFCPTIA